MFTEKKFVGKIFRQKSFRKKKCETNFKNNFSSFLFLKKKSVEFG